MAIQEQLDQLFGLRPEDRQLLRKGLVPARRYESSDLPTLLVLGLVGTLFVALQGWALHWTLAALAGVVVVSVLLTAPLRRVLERYVRHGDPALVSLVKSEVRIEVHEEGDNRTAWLHTAEGRSFELPEGFLGKRASGRFRLFLACSSAAMPGLQFDDPKESLEAMEPLEEATLCDC